MDTAAFAHMAATESSHWWFVGRRAVIDALISGLVLPEAGKILEAGCGTGGNIATLRRHGSVSAFEPHVDALAYARERHPDDDILPGALPSQVPHEPGSFDLVAALDVLEHVDDDVGSASALADLVRPGGWLIVTVPAHQALWGSHDRRLHHVRRYGRAEMLRLFERDDLELVRCTPFNMVLAPIAVLYRILETVLRLDLGNQERVPPSLLNRLLGRLFGMEAWWVRTGRGLPYGISYAAVFRRRGLAADAPHGAG
jgi:SAM-dependent methyltransferase